MKKRKYRIKVIGLGDLGVQVINRLLTSDLKPVAEQALYIDRELLVDNGPGKIYFLDDCSYRWDIISKIKTHNKYLWPGDKYLSRIMSGVDLIILIFRLDGDEAMEWLPLISETSKGLKIPLIGLGTFPFSFEGKWLQKTGEERVEELKQATEWVLVFPLDQLLIDSPHEANLSDLLEKAEEKLGGIVEELISRVSRLEGDRDQTGLKKALIEMDGRFKGFDGKWGALPSRDELDRKLMGLNHPIFFNEVE